MSGMHRPVPLAGTADALRARLLAPVLAGLLRQIRTGHLVLTLPDGRTLEAGTAGQTPAAATLHNWRPLSRLLLGGELGFAESYLDGDWSSPDLAAFFAVIQGNRETLQQRLQGTWLARWRALAGHRRNANTRRGSRRNIQSHYDLGNDFYRLWLDPGMSYSSALFSDGANSLEAAQDDKYRAIARMIGLKPGARVLEIGCGWGGFAEIAAREFGAQVDGITLSSEQLAHARDRIARAGLDDRVRLSLTDYRDTAGTYDHVVSIEMFEAVGEENWATFFETVRARLRQGGNAGLQVITIDDAIFPRYRLRADFIQRHVFPGGLLPGPTALKTAAERAGLAVETSRFFGRDYETTLRDWHRRFEAAWPDIERLRGFDARFRRLWRYYLLSCAEGFREGSIDVGMFRLRAP